MEVKLTIYDENTNDTEYISPDDIEFINDLFDINLIYDPLKEIKEIKFKIKEEILERDHLDSLYFFTREKLLNLFISNKHHITDFNDMQLEYLRKLFPNLSNTLKKIVLNKASVDITETHKGYINFILYNIIKNSKKISDINIIHHFIDNHYEPRFSDLILIYPKLDKEYINMILTDQNCNPIVKDEYKSKKEELMEIEDALSLPSEELEKYYTKIWINENFPNKNNIGLELIKSKKATHFMINDFLIRNEFKYIDHIILSHPNCPKDIIELFSSHENYIPFILKNEEIDSIILDKIYHHTFISNNYDKILNKIINHKNCNDSTKNKILKEINVINENNFPNSLDNLSPNLKLFLIKKYEKENFYPEILKNILIRNDKEQINKIYNNFHQNLIEQSLRNYSLENLLQISNYIEDFSSIDDLISKHLDENDYDWNKTTNIINTLDINNKTKTYRKLKTNVINLIKKSENQKELTKMYKDISKNELTFCLKKEDLKLALQEIKNNKNTPKNIKLKIA